MEPETDGQEPVSVVVGARSQLVTEILRELDRRGRSAVTTGEAPSESADGPRGAVEECFAEACGERPVDLVVHAGSPPGAALPQPLLEMDDDDWDLRCESIVRSTLLVLQAARRRMASGGSIVLVLPSISLTGSAGLAAWSAAAESQRVLAKVAARRWGHSGIRVNVVSVPPETLGAEPPSAMASADDPSSPAAAADLVCMLATTDARSLNGATLVADGGNLMVP